MDLTLQTKLPQTQTWRDILSNIWKNTLSFQCLDYREKWLSGVGLAVKYITACHIKTRENAGTASPSRSSNLKINLQGHHMLLKICSFFLSCTLHCLMSLIRSALIARSTAKKQKIDVLSLYASQNTQNDVRFECTRLDVNDKPFCQSMPGIQAFSCDHQSISWSMLRPSRHPLPQPILSLLSTTPANQPTLSYPDTWRHTFLVYFPHVFF